jgi:hypothetical protein
MRKRRSLVIQRFLGDAGERLKEGYVEDIDNSLDSFGP